MDWNDHYAETDETLTEQRKEHTKESDKVVSIIKEQFLEIQRLKLENQELRNKLYTAS